MITKDFDAITQNFWTISENLRGNSKLNFSQYKLFVLSLIFFRSQKQAYRDELISREGQVHFTKDEIHKLFEGLQNSSNLSKDIQKLIHLLGKVQPHFLNLFPDELYDISNGHFGLLWNSLNNNATQKMKQADFAELFGQVATKFAQIKTTIAENGENHPPSTLLQLIINYLEPEGGLFYDPTCGEGNTLVEIEKFNRSIDNHINKPLINYASELKNSNLKIAKLNTAINDIQVTLTEMKSYYEDPYSLTDRCDYLIAYPPFNLKIENKLRHDPDSEKRFPFGIPSANKANFLWIQYFYNLLNNSGKAGFLMANSATDAGNSELTIRKKLIRTGAIDCIVSINNNFLYPRPKPCDLWFIDKSRISSDSAKSKSILMIDARNIFTRVSTTVNVFSDDQIKNLLSLMKLYRGDLVKITQADEWLSNNFPQGQYRDIEGICKTVSLTEIEQNEFSLAPGKYISPIQPVDENLDYSFLLNNINQKMNYLNAEAGRLTNKINSLLNNLQ